MESSVLQGIKLYKFKNVLVSDMVMSKGKILTQGYE